MVGASVQPKYGNFLFLALIAAGLVANHFSFPIFFNIDFLFGSIFSMLALQLFGTGRGLLAAALIASYTYALWDHPYAIAIMTAEVAVVAWLTTQRKMGMVLADTLYWLFVGMPLDYLIYGFILDSSPDGIYFILTKQAVNGIANALLARLLFTALALWSRRTLVPYRDLIYNLLAFFALFPVLTLLMLASSRDFAETDQHIRSTLAHDARMLSRSLDRWLQQRTNTVVQLTRLGATLTSTQMQPRLEQALATDPSLQRIGMRNPDSIITAYAPALDEHGQSNVGKQFPERPYISTLKSTLQPMLPEVVMGRIDKPEPIAIVLAPVVRQGSYAGYVNAVLNLDPLRDQLEDACADSMLHYTLLDQKGNIILTNRTDQKVMTPLQRGAGDLLRLDESISQWVPTRAANRSASSRWSQSVYVSETAVDPMAQWRLVLEQPVAPFQKMLFARYANALALLFLLLLAALALAEFLSRRAVASTEQLSALAQDLPGTLEAGHPAAWPSSALAEPHRLIESFKAMADSLAAQFLKVQQVNALLEQRVRNRTAALQESHAFNLAILNSLPAEIAVLDRRGVIQAVNGAWRQFSALNGPHSGTPAPNTGVGSDYLAVCHDDVRADGVSVGESIRAVIDGASRGVSLEYACPSPHEARWFSMSVTPLESPGGGAVIVHTDISQRKGLEDALKESEFRWKFAIEGSGVGVWDWDIESGAASYSNLWKQMLGYDDTDAFATSQEWVHLIHPEDRTRVLQANHDYLEGEAPLYAVEFRLRCGDESYKWVFSRGLVVSRTKDGRPARMIGTHADITQRKHDEQALLNSNAELHSIQETTLDGFWHIDGHGHLVDVNDSYCRQSGYSREELLGLKIHQLDALESAADVALHMERLRQQGHDQFTTRHRRKDGSLWHVEVSATYRDVTGPRVFAFLRDITERKQVQQQLMESESRLRAIIDTEPECIKIVDAGGGLVNMNPAGLMMIEADSLEQAQSHPLLDFIAPKYHADFLDLHQRVLAGESLIMEFETVGLKGQRRWMETHAVPMRDRGQIVQLAVTRDISERKRADTALRVAAVAFESQEAMMITDADSVILSINRAFTRITGYAEDEVVGQTPRMLQSGRHDRAFYRAMWHTLDRTGSWQGEIWDRRKNGEVYPKWLSISVVKDDAGAVTHYIGSHHEISERKNAEATLRKMNQALSLSKQELRALAANSEIRLEGERKHIAREVHDELGQVLTALRMNMSLAYMRHAAQAPALKEDIHAMKAMVDRAIQGVRNVAVNLRPAALDMGLVPAIEWLCSEFHQSSGIPCALHSQEESVNLDETRAVVMFRIVQESLTNIARYARASQVDVSLGQRGHELGLEVRDNGCGFDLARAEQEKSFGLLGMRERALALGGRVDVISAPGLGTVVAVTIPLDFDLAQEAP